MGGGGRKGRYLQSEQLRRSAHHFGGFGGAGGDTVERLKIIWNEIQKKKYTTLSYSLIQFKGNLKGNGTGNQFKGLITVID